MSRRIAFLIDGGFFLRRLPHLVRPEHCVNAERITVTLRHLCRNCPIPDVSLLGQRGGLLLAREVLREALG